MNDLYIELKSYSKQFNLEVDPIKSNRSSINELLPEFTKINKAV